MSYDAPNMEEREGPRKGKLRGVPGGTGETADESGGRSTGIFTGFGGGSIQNSGGGNSRGGGGGGGGRSRAVVKGRYVKSGNTKNVKASLRYYTTRENERGEPMERTAFSSDTDSLARSEANERLEAADRNHAYHYRMAVSPGTDRDAEGIDLKDYTRQVMTEAERQQRGSVSWVAVEHAGNSAHTERAHVHIILSTNKTFDRKDFETLREHATRSFERAREDSRFLDRDASLREDMKALGELSERQRESKRELAQERPNFEKGRSRDHERDDPKRNASREQEENASEGEENARSRSRGRER